MSDYWGGEGELGGGELVICRGIECGEWDLEGEGEGQTDSCTRRARPADSAIKMWSGLVGSASTARIFEPTGMGWPFEFFDFRSRRVDDSREVEVWKKWSLSVVMDMFNDDDLDDDDLDDDD